MQLKRVYFFLKSFLYSASKTTGSAIITREKKFYVALAPDVDIVSQGETIEEALVNLKEALELYFVDDDAHIS